MAEVRVRRGALAAVYVAGGASGFGTQMTLLALPWLVLETSGSATRTGLVFAVQVLPMALLGFVGGEVLQRLGAHRTMVTSDLVRGPLVALVPVLHVLGVLSLPALLAIVAAHGVFGVPYFASQRVLATELVGEDDRALTRVNSVLETVYNTASFSRPVGRRTRGDCGNVRWVPDGPDGGGTAMAGPGIRVLGAEQSVPRMARRPATGRG